MYLLSVMESTPDGQFGLKQFCFADGETIEEVKRFYEEADDIDQEHSYAVIFHCKCSSGSCLPIEASSYGEDWQILEEKSKENE
jgi:hypothetical protein